MKDKRSVFIFGMHADLAIKVIDSLSKHFENVSGAISLKEILLLMNSTPPDLIVIGGGVPSEMRNEIFKTKTELNLKILIAEPNGPHDILDSIDRVDSMSEKN